MMIIGVTDTMGAEHKFKKYTEWLHRGGAGIEVRILSYRLNNLAEVDSCDALVLTGGHDVDPRLYGGPVSHHTIGEVDRKRDDFEVAALDRALQEEMPILGICRGMQLANVRFGGTLLPDIEEAGFKSHRSNKDAEARHGVILEDGSGLLERIGRKSGETNTSHHQAVMRPGDGLLVAARSTDGIIEALELEKSARKSFFLLVQWHPERMADHENVFTKTILESFISSVKSINFT